MENEKLIYTCERLLEYIINGFIIDDQVVFGLFTDTDLSISQLSVSDIDITIIKIAIVLFCINNDNISINTNGDIEISAVSKTSTSKQYGGTKKEKINNLMKKLEDEPVSVHTPTTHVRANRGIYMIYRYLFLLISILSIASGLRALFYLYQNTMEAKWLIMSQSVDKLIFLSENFPSPDIVGDVDNLLELIQEYNKKYSGNTPETSTDLVLIESFATKIVDLKDSQLYIPSQLDIPDENIDILTLIDLNKPIMSILHIYRHFMNYFFEFRQSQIEELLYNNEVYKKVEIYFHEKKKILEEVNQIFKTFQDQILKEPQQLESTSFYKTLKNGITGYLSGESSTVDITRAKITLLKSIVDNWSKIMIKAPTETSYAISSISGFIKNITDIIGLIQEQILISTTIYSFFQFILYLIYQKFIYKKIPTADWEKIKNNFKPIVEESVKIYFSKYNVDKNDEALQKLTEIFIDLFHAKITDPTSGLINYGTTPEETIEQNKQEMQEYIISCIDFLVKNHSLRNDIIHNMIMFLFKSRPHLFTNDDLDPVYKLMTIYFEEDSVDEDISSLKNPRNILRLQNGEENDEKDDKIKIEGGKKHKKSRKTRTIKTRRHKRSKIYKRTRRHKRYKQHRRSRKSKK